MAPFFLLFLFRLYYDVNDDDVESRDIYLFIYYKNKNFRWRGLTSYDFVIAMNQPGGATVATFNGLLKSFSDLI